MAFGTARRLKADVAEGARSCSARLGVRRAGSVGVVAFGAGRRRGVLPPRGSKPGMVALRELLERGRRARRPARARRAGGRARARVARLARAARAGGRDLRLPRPARLGAPARRAAPAPRGARGRGRRSARGRAAGASGASRWSTPRPASGSRSTPPARRVRERFAELERERRDAVAARAAARCASHHVALSTDAGLAARAGAHGSR